MKIRLYVITALGTAALAACSGGSGPTVASGTTPPAAAASAAGHGGRTSEGNGGVLLAYSQCMRQHGVSNFPDLSGTVITPQTLQSQGVDTSSPVYQRAAQACRPKLFGGTGSGTGPRPATVLQFSRCVRQHGIPNFPDPTVQGSAISISIKGTGVSPQSPVFQNAMRACLKYLRKNVGTGGA